MVRDKKSVSSFAFQIIEHDSNADNPRCSENAAQQKVESRQIALKHEGGGSEWGHVSCVGLIPVGSSRYQQRYGTAVADSGPVSTWKTALHFIQPWEGSILKSF